MLQLKIIRPGSLLGVIEKELTEEQARRVLLAADDRFEVVARSDFEHALDMAHHHVTGGSGWQGSNALVNIIDDLNRARRMSQQLAPREEAE